ncbi:hypothetical protein DEMA109039_15875 [Deinococcus marmoris]
MQKLIVLDILGIAVILLFASLYYSGYVAGGVNDGMQSEGRGPVTSVHFSLLSFKFTYQGVAGVAFLNLPFLLSMLLLLINAVWISIDQIKKESSTAG